MCDRDADCAGASVCRQPAQMRGLVRAACVCPPTRGYSGSLCDAPTTWTWVLAILAGIQCAVALSVGGFVAWTFWRTHSDAPKPVQRCAALAIVALTCAGTHGAVALAAVLDNTSKLDMAYNAFFVCTYVSFGALLVHVALLWHEHARTQLGERKETLLRVVALGYFVASALGIVALYATGQWIWAPAVMLPALASVVAFFARTWWRLHILAPLLRRVGTGTEGRDGHAHALRMMRRASGVIVALGAAALLCGTLYASLTTPDAQVCVSLVLVLGVLVETVVARRVVRVLVHVLARTQSSSRTRSGSPRPASKRGRAPSKDTGSKISVDTEGPFVISGSPRESKDHERMDEFEVNAYELTSR